MGRPCPIRILLHVDRQFRQHKADVDGPVCRDQDRSQVKIKLPRLFRIQVVCISPVINISQLEVPAVIRVLKTHLPEVCIGNIGFTM